MEIIGVFGTIGSGKSHFSATIAEARGFAHINTDLVFKESVLSDIAYRDAAGKFFSTYGVLAFVDGRYNSVGITQLLFSAEQSKSDWPVLTAFNTLNRPYVVTAIDARIASHRRVILEAATLPNIPELYMRCRMAIRVTAGDPMRVAEQLDRIAKRDPHRNMELSEQVLRYQTYALRHIHIPHTTINTLESGEWRDTSSVLAEFDRARTHSWLSMGRSNHRLAH